MIFTKSIFVLLTTDFLLSAESLTWTAPPPAWTPTGVNDIRTVKYPVLNGSTNVAFRWNYTLGTNEFLFSTVWNLNGTQIATLFPVTVIKDDRFDLNTSEVATLIIKNVSELEDATFQCQVQTIEGTWKYNIRLEIIVPPRMTSYSDNQTVNEGSNLSLFCNATGKPAPNITWTRVSEDEVLFVGNPWHIVNINRTYSGTYRCIADNGVPSPVNSTISVNVLFPPRLTSYSDNQTVNEGSDLSLFCNATGKPAPNINWTRVPEDEVLFVGNPWHIASINRTYSGTYRCIADNGVPSPVISTISINVLFKPDNVTLERNTTENNGCTDMWVNFTCKSSEANPPVYNYVLLMNETDVGLSEKGTWIEKISHGGTFVYKCQANQQVDNVTSANNISLSVKVSVAVEQIQNVTVEEGRNVTKECNVTAGTPPVNCFWKNVKTGQVTKGKRLTIINIRRNQSGEYRYTANNTCGNESTGMFIDVHFKPDNVTLERNTTENNGCSDMWVNFTCKSSEANPPVHNYLLLRNETDVGLSGKGTWIEKISRGETFIYKCRSYQKVDNVSSTDNVTVTVNDAPTMKQLLNVTVKESENVTKECNVAAGTPPLDFFWKNVKTGQVTKGKLLTIINIRRNQGGEYRCIANNTCGNESTTMFINVEYPPSNISTIPDMKVNETDEVQLYCTADGNPPPRTRWTRLPENNPVPKVLNITGKQDEGLYRCTAENDIGNAATKDVNITVIYHRPHYTLLQTNISNNSVTMNEIFSITCITEANPPAKYVIYRDETRIVGNNSVVISSVAERVKRVTFTCKPSNFYGVGQMADVSLDVLYHPYIISKGPYVYQIQEGSRTSYPCPIDGNPSPDFKWYSGKGTSRFIHSGKNLSISKTLSTDSEWYTCHATNKLGDKIIYLRLIVAEKSTTSSVSPTVPGSEEPFCEKPFHRKNCEIHWTMVGILIGCSLVFVVVVAVIIGYYVQKRRNCRHPTKVHDSSPDVQPLSSNQGTPPDGNIYAGENGGYAKSGPLPTVDMVTEQQLGAVGGEAIPTYSTVDKSKKKDKKKDKKAAEQKEMENQYAAVDKTKKKKKKNEVDDTYAEVDMSKKSKKNPKAVEVLYADLGEFHAMQKMPEVSTSPKPLPPIKMPEAYGETQYADITQFLKEKPGDTGAEPPKESTTSAVRDTATGSKEESPAGNVGDGAEAINETGF